MKLTGAPLVLTAAGNSVPIPVDTRLNITLLGVNIQVVTGPVTYTVQYTLDDVYASGYLPASGNWYPTTITGNSATAGQAANWSNLCTAIRLNVSAITAGSVSIMVFQADSSMGG